MIDLAKEIWQTMRTNRLRTFLTGFSVSWGIFMLILLLSLANGMVKMSGEYQSKNDPMRLTLYPSRTTMPYKGLKEGRYIELNTKQFEVIESSGHGKISNVTGSVWINGEVSSQRDYLKTSYARGVYPDHFNGSFKFIYGRPFNQADIDGLRKVLIINEPNAKTLFGSADKAVGGNVKVNGYSFTVVGVYKHDWEEGVFVPLTTADALTGFTGDVSVVDVHMQDISSVEESEAIESGVRKTLAQEAKFDPADDGAVWIYNRYANQESNKTGNNILTYTMWVIGILTLISGIVGVSNIMFVSVRERTHEIGIRRAIGARPRHIITQVLLESVALTTVFGYIGIVIGTIVTEIVRHYLAGTSIGLNPTVDLGIALQVTVTLIVAGALAGLFPALRALKVKPVEALSEE